MAWRVEGLAFKLIDIQFFLVFQPMIRRRSRSKGNSEHVALAFQVIPKWHVFRMKRQGSSRGFCDLPGREKVIQMSVSVDDLDNSQSQ